MAHKDAFEMTQKRCMKMCLKDSGSEINEIEKGCMIRFLFFFFFFFFSLSFDFLFYLFFSSSLLSFKEKWVPFHLSFLFL